MSNLPPLTSLRIEFSTVPPGSSTGLSLLSSLFPNTVGPRLLASGQPVMGMFPALKKDRQNFHGNSPAMAVIIFRPTLGIAFQLRT